MVSQGSIEVPFFSECCKCGKFLGMSMVKIVPTEYQLTVLEKEGKLISGGLCSTCTRLAEAEARITAMRSNMLENILG